MKTRNEHVEWCKERAEEYLEMEEVDNAYLSMVSDLAKHEETCDHPAIMLGMQLMFNGSLSGVPEMRKFIQGFN